MSVVDNIKQKLFEDLQIKQEILKPKWKVYLDSNFIPKDPKHRESEIRGICLSLIETISQNTTSSLLIYGQPGTGKTMSFKLAKSIIDDVLDGLKYILVYVCATSSSVATLMHDICNVLGYKMPKRGISFKEYMYPIYEVVNRGYHIHICVDEFDKLLQGRSDYHGFLYYFTRTDGVSLTLITNRMDLVRDITDGRVLSSLDTINTIFFKSYTKEQCIDILGDRIAMAFKEGFIGDDALELLAEHIANEGGDIRLGLSILRFCANYAILHKIKRVDSTLMEKIIYKHNIFKEGENLVMLPISDKIILVALYKLSMASRSDFVDSRDVFAEQDYYRKLLKIPSIDRESYSIYLTKLSTMGLIEIKRIGRGRGLGTRSLIRLRCAREAIKYMLDNDDSLSPIKSDWRTNF